MKFTIIIPAHNEESTIKEILSRVSNQKNNHDLEIIVIDDGSTDNTINIIEENIHLVDKLIKLHKNLGKGGAVIEGLKSASGEYILFQDADLEYNPKDYDKIFSVIKELNADIVIGSRFLAPKYVRVHYFWHSVGNKFITFLFNVLYNTTFTDIYSCYFAVRTNLIDIEKLKHLGWSQQAEILGSVVKKGKVFYEVPISYSGRTYDEGKKIRARNVISVILTILKKRLF
tara:strand:+ start:2102 stop:2788 length:687 start_codon:yes stop_codon:yes gene_type:complete